MLSVVASATESKHQGERELGTCSRLKHTVRAEPFDIAQDKLRGIVAQSKHEPFDSPFMLSVVASATESKHQGEGEGIAIAETGLCYGRGCWIPV
jgi:hypothetical protein